MLRFIAVLFAFGAASGAPHAQSAWPADSAAARAASFNDPAQWDTAALERDAQYADRIGAVPVPIRIGVFPTPPYESPGNGNVQLSGMSGNARVTGEAIFVGRGPHNEAAFPDSTSTSEVFFVVLVAPGDTVAAGRSYASSRNHPDYLAEGSIPTDQGSLDWLAVQNADRTAWAVANTRLFDLQFGRVVLVAPQADGTLRFYQVQAPFLTSDTVERYTERLLASDAAIDFFARPQ